MAYNKYARSKPLNVIQKYAMDREGSIYPVLGETYSIKEELKALGAQYTGCLGWFFVDREKAMKCGRPFCEIAVKAITRMVDVDRYDFIYEDEIKAMVAAFQPQPDPKTFEPSTSKFMGTVGQLLQDNMTVKKTFTFNGKFGKSTMFVMENEEGDVFVWTTTSRDETNYPVDTKWTVVGQVKEHKIYEGVEQTILTRCKFS